MPELYLLCIPPPTIKYSALNLQHVFISCYGQYHITGRNVEGMGRKCSTIPRYIFNIHMYIDKSIVEQYCSKLLRRFNFFAYIV